MSILHVADPASLVRYCSWYKKINPYLWVIMQCSFMDESLLLGSKPTCSIQVTLLYIWDLSGAFSIHVYMSLAQVLVKHSLIHLIKTCIVIFSYTTCICQEIVNTVVHWTILISVFLAAEATEWTWSEHHWWDLHA